MVAPYSPSLTPPAFVYVAVSSAGVEVQDGRKARGKEKNRTKKKTKNRAKKKIRKMEVGLNRIPEGGECSIPEVKCFPPGTGLSFSEKMAAGTPGIFWHINPHDHFLHVSSQCLLLQTLLTQL